MRVRFTFTVDAPDSTRIDVLRAAGERAAGVVENVVEEDNAKNQPCTAGEVRITIKANETRREPIPF